MLTRLVAHIQEFIINSDTPWIDHNLLQIYQTCLHTDSFSQLRKYCEDRITCEPDQFTQSNEFLSLDEKGLLTLLKRDDFAMDEIDIWDNVIRWGIVSCQNLNPDITEWSDAEMFCLEKKLRSLIPHIRFFNISSSDYYYRILPFKKILPSELRKALKAFYLVPGSCAPDTSLAPRTPIHTIDSLIITAKQSAWIAHWIEGKEGIPKPFAPHQYKFTLLLRGSVNGFDMYEFHAKCDLKGPTIVLLRLTDGMKAIGGYNPYSWESTGLFKSTSKSFIFSMNIGSVQTEGEGYTLSRVLRERFAIKDFHGSIGGEEVGFGDGDLPLFRYKCKQKSYEKKVLEETQYRVEEFEVFLVEKMDRNI